MERSSRAWVAPVINIAFPASDTLVILAPVLVISKSEASGLASTFFLAGFSANICFSSFFSAGFSSFFSTGFSSFFSSFFYSSGFASSFFSTGLDSSFLSSSSLVVLAISEILGEDSSSFAGVTRSSITSFY